MSHIYMIENELREGKSYTALKLCSPWNRFKLKIVILKYKFIIWWDT